MRRLWVLIACVGVLVIGQQAADYRNRSAISDSQRAGCVRGLFDRVDAIETDLDLAMEFAGEGAKRASARAVRRIGRLLGADPEVLSRIGPDGKPHPEALALARVTCARQSPGPSWLP